MQNSHLHCHLDLSMCNEAVIKEKLKYKHLEIVMCMCVRVYFVYYLYIQEHIDLNVSCFFSFRNTVKEK